MSITMGYVFDQYTLGNINLTVPWFLMASYLYYSPDYNISLIEDYCFDNMCSIMLERWDDIEHPHKHLITKEHLIAGTGFDIKNYPTITKTAAIQLAREWGMLT